MAFVMSPPILAFENLGLIQGTGWLFRHLDLFIQPQDRLAFIGRNGAGKTTLFRLLAGTLEADEGRRTIVPGRRVVLLDQDPSVSNFLTLRDFALAGGGAAHDIESIADQIGIDLSRDAASASGGERRRAAIARTLALEPDVLLLDEPTNHLDLAAINWIEEWLAGYKGAFVAISHDRTFLTRLTRSTLWLDRGQMRRKDIGFGGFDTWAEAIYAEEARAAEKLDAKLKLEEHWLLRGVTARRARNEGRKAKLMEMRAARAAMLGPQGSAKLGLATDQDVRSKSVINAQGVNKSFGDRTIIRNFTLRIQRGDRIGIVGANGAGKTTLLKLLTGELAPDEGSITIAKTLSGVIIDQQRALMAPTKRIRDVLADGGDWIEVRGVKKHIQGYLKEFLFPPNLADALVGTLSGGERSRLLLAREFARASNLLVLDEPTNDLDLETLDLLQDVIADYEGTVLIVSHDRDFLDRTVSLTLGLDGSGAVDIVAGGYADWERKRTIKASPPRQETSAKSAKDQPKAPPAPRVKLTYRDQRDYDLLPARVEELNAQIARDEAALSDPALYARDPKRFAALTAAIEAARAEKDTAEDRWLILAEQVEALG
jgi:ABC transport system ATP-binding/permease protein